MISLFHPQHQLCYNITVTPLPQSFWKNASTKDFVWVSWFSLSLSLSLSLSISLCCLLRFIHQPRLFLSFDTGLKIQKRALRLLPPRGPLGSHPLHGEAHHFLPSQNLLRERDSSSCFLFVANCRLVVGMFFKADKDGQFLYFIVFLALHYKPSDQVCGDPCQVLWFFGSKQHNSRWRDEGAWNFSPPPPSTKQLPQKQSRTTGIVIFFFGRRHDLACPKDPAVVLENSNSKLLWVPKTAEIVTFLDERSFSNHKNITKQQNIVNATRKTARKRRHGTKTPQQKKNS